jgi:hypothetical protein
MPSWLAERSRTTAKSRQSPPLFRKYFQKLGRVVVFATAILEQGGEVYVRQGRFANPLHLA